MMPEGIKLFYGKQFVDCFQAVTRTANFSFDMSYEEVVNIAKPYLVKKGKECIDKDESLFKVSVLVHGDEKKQIILVFSVSTVLVDVHTFYCLYEQMNGNKEGRALNAIRNTDYTKTLRSTLGKAEMSWMHESSSRQNGIALSLCFSTPVRVAASYLDEETWLPTAKKTHTIGTSWVSTNDILTSWFFNLCQCDYAFMKVNFRGRMLDLSETHAGNYSDAILYRPEDFDQPILIRKSLAGFRRAARIESYFWKGKTHGTSLPGVVASLQNNSAAAENWCGAYRNVLLPGHIQLLHLPIITDFQLLPHRNTMYIFKPTAGAVGILTFVRDMLLIDEEYNPRKGLILSAKKTTNMI